MLTEQDLLDAKNYLDEFARSNPEHDPEKTKAFNDKMGIDPLQAMMWYGREYNLDAFQMLDAAPHFAWGLVAGLYLADRRDGTS